jgi:hypothetical protein
MKTLNPLFELGLYLDVSVVRDHVMTGALADVMTNLDGLAVREEDFLLSGLGDLINTWNVLGKLSYGDRRSPSPEQAKSYSTSGWDVGRATDHSCSKEFRT